MVWPVRKDVLKAPTPELPPLCLDAGPVTLRPPRMSDQPAWASVRARNYDDLQPWEPVWPEGCLSAEFFTRRLRRQAKDWDAGTAYSFIILLGDENGPLIGGVNLNHVALGAARSASLGYWLDQDHRGNGYMTEALSAVMDWAFTSLNLHRINAACLPHNERSIAVLRTLSFAEEGFAKSYYRINGVWEDHILFGKVTGRE